MRTALIFVAFFGCSSDSQQQNITKTIGSVGGTVETDAGTSLNVPSGALSSNTTLTIARIDVTGPASTVLVGSAFDFGPEGTTFAQPVTITLPFDPAKLPAGRTSADIRVYTAPRGSSTYTALPTTLVGNTVQTTTSHFTVYLPAVAMGEVILDMSVAKDAAPTVDFASAPPHDLAAPDCTPVCTPGTSGCGCTEKCGTTTFTMTCSPGSSGYNCFCEVNGQTQSITPMVLDCTSTSELQSKFLQCAG
jgi:hypothetical protein